MSKIKYILLTVFSFFFLVVLLYFGFILFVRHEKNHIADWINQHFPLYHIQFDDIHLSLFQLSPVIAFDNLKIYPKNLEKQGPKNIFIAEKIFLHFNVWEIVKKHQFIPDKVIIKKTHISATLPASYSFTTKTPALTNYLPALDKALKRFSELHNILFLDTNIDITFPTGKKLTILTNIEAQGFHDHLRLSGTFLPKEKLSPNTTFQLRYFFTPQKIIFDLQNLQLDFNGLQPYLLTTQIPATFKKFPKAQFDANIQSLHWQKALNKPFHLQICTKNTSIKIAKQIPALKNITTIARFSPNKGQLSIQMKNSLLIWPTMFRKALNLTTGQANLAWHKQDDLYQFSGNVLNLKTATFNVQSKFHFHFSTHSTVYTDIQANFQADKISQKNIYAYLPVGILPNSLVRWLDTALQGTGKSNGQLILRGDLKHFPFDHHNGLFLIQSHVNQANLKFLPTWPGVKNITADLLFKNRIMNINATQAKSLALNVDTANAFIGAIGEKTSPLILKIKINTSPTAALAYLTASQLLPQNWENLLTKTSFQGLVYTNLKITLPISGSAAMIPTVQGETNLEDLKLNIPSLNMNIKNINGNLRFDDDKIRTNNLQARWDKDLFSIQFNAKNTQDHNFKTTINLQNLKKSPYSYTPIAHTKTAQQKEQHNFLLKLSNTQNIKKFSPLPGTTESSELNFASIKHNNNAYSPKKLEVEVLTPRQINQSYPVKVTIKKAIWSGLPQLSHTTTPLLLEVWPTDVLLSIQNLILNTYAFGNLSVNTHTNAVGDIKISQFLLQQAAFTINGNGIWHKKNNTTQSEINVQINNLPIVLQRFKLAPDLNAKKFSLHATLSYPGFFNALSFKTLQARATFSMQSGYLRSTNKSTTQKIGFLYFLDLLDLESLASKFKEGGYHQGKFYFNTLQGDVQLQQGYLQINKLLIDGEMTKIQIQGNINLLTGNYQLTVHLIPPWMASVPVLTTVAAGPVAGLAIWAIDKMLSPAVNKLTKYTYTLQGNFNIGASNNAH